MGARTLNHHRRGADYRVPDAEVRMVRRLTRPARVQRRCQVILLDVQVVAGLQVHQNRPVVPKNPPPPFRAGGAAAGPRSRDRQAGTSARSSVGARARTASNSAFRQATRVSGSGMAIGSIVSAMCAVPS